MKKSQDKTICFYRATDRDIIDALKKCGAVAQGEGVWVFEDAENAYQVFTGSFGNLKLSMYINDFELLPYGDENGQFGAINVEWGKFWNKKVGEKYGSIRQLKHNADVISAKENYQSYSEAFLSYWNDILKQLRACGQSENAKKVETIINTYKQKVFSLSDDELQK